MKRFHPLSVLVVAAILILLAAIPNTSTAAVAQHCLRIEEYKVFQDTLDPLQHEALPPGDFPRIRVMSSELVTRGKAIVKLGVPEAPKANRREFAKARRTFDKALAKFKIDAKTGSDSRLKASFVAVHDSFEKLADLLSSVYPGGSGSPPTVTLDCPSSQLESGSTISLNAIATLPEKLRFAWKLDKGKILTGDGTRTITIDTTGLAGLTISVSVEVDDGCGLAAFAKCQLKISESQPPK